MLLEERGDDLGALGALGVCGKEAAVADVAPGADHDEVNARDAAVDDTGDDVRVDAAMRLDILPRLHARERAHLVAVDRRLLVMALVRRALHLLREALDHIVLAAFQK